MGLQVPETITVGLDKLNQLLLEVLEETSIKRKLVGLKIQEVSILFVV
jgi:hypothetical protein